MHLFHFNTELTERSRRHAFQITALKKESTKSSAQQYPQSSFTEKSLNN